MTCTPECRKPNGNQAHCGADGCHQTFAGITAFDAHRAGPVDERHCRPPADCGMRLNAWGVWSQSGDGRPAFWDRPQPSGDTQTPEPALVGGIGRAEALSDSDGFCDGQPRTHRTEEQP